jgi:prolipoprotein diacylglyceryl transferase
MIRWDVDPVALHIGFTALRWYTLFFTAGYMIGYGIFKYLMRHERIAPRYLDILALLSVVLSLAGARLFHVVFYDWPYFRTHPEEILNISKGGLASHGGGLGLVAAALVWTHFFRPDLRTAQVVDLMTIPCAWADVLIRLGNFFNSELVGTPTTLPWGVVFTRVDGQPRHPVQLYEAVAYLGVFLTLIFLWKQSKSFSKPGKLILTAAFLLGTFIPRFALEFLKAPTGLVAFVGPLTTGQALSIPFILAGVFLLLRKRKS